MRVTIISVIIVEVAITRKVIDKGFDHIAFLEVWRELEAIWAVEKYCLFPWWELIILDLVNWSILFARNHNVVLTKPLAVLTGHCVIFFTGEECYGVVWWVRRRVFQRQKCRSRVITTLVDGHLVQLRHHWVIVTINHLTWRMLGQETAQAKVNRQEAAVAVKAWEVRINEIAKQDVLEYFLIEKTVCREVGVYCVDSCGLNCRIQRV